MSFQHGQRCFASQQDAWASLAAAEVGSIREHAGSLHVLDVAAVTTAGIQYQLVPVGGGPPVAFTSSPSMQPCALLDASDAVQMGWLVAAAWLAVFAVKFLGKGLQQ